MSRQGQQQCANPSEIDRSHQAWSRSSNQCLGVSASGENTLPRKLCMVHVCTQALCMWVTVGTSLPTPHCPKQRPLLQLTGDLCIMFSKAALLLLEVRHKGPGLFLLRCHWFTYCFVIQYWQLPSGAQQNHSAYSPCHRNNIHQERLGEAYNPSAFFAVHNLKNL